MLRDVESSLISRACRGDVEAAGVLFERWRQEVYVVIYNTIRRPEETEDLVEEVYLRFHGSLGRIDPSRNPKAFVLTTARNCAIDYLRRCRKLLPVDDLIEDTPVLCDELRYTAENPEAAAIVKEEAAIHASFLEHSLRLLTDRQRSCITMLYFDDMNQHDIALILGVSDATVSRERRLALWNLRRYWEECKGGVK